MLHPILKTGFERDVQQSLERIDVLNLTLNSKMNMIRELSLLSGPLFSQRLLS